MIKVLFIAPYPYNDTEITGGVEAVTVNYVKAFSAHENIKVDVITFTANLKASEIRAVKNNISIHFIQDSFVKNQRMFFLLRGRALLKTKIAELRPDLIHFQGNGPHLLLSLGLSKANLIITQHGNILEEMKNQPSLIGKTVYFINYLIEKICAKNVRYFVFISDYNKRITSDSVTWMKKYAVINNPVDATFFNIQSKKKNGLNIIFVGGIRRAKGLIILLEALSNLAVKGMFFSLNIVGDTVERNYRKACEDFVSQNELRGVTFRGKLSQAELKKLYEEIDILVLPSLQECLPVSIAEAMCAGRAVVASNVGGISEMLDGVKTGFLFKKGSVKQLEETLELLYNNTELQTQTGINAKLWASQNYSPEFVVQKTINFYREVLSTKD